MSVISKTVEFLLSGSLCVILLLNQNQKKAFVFPNNDDNKT